MSYDRRIDDELAAEPRVFGPVHPGEILQEEFLEPLGWSQNELARRLGISPRRVNEIILRKRAVTANTALRLARLFDMSPEFWLGLQSRYELDLTEDQIGERVKKEVVPFKRRAA